MRNDDAQNKESADDPKEGPFFELYDPKGRYYGTWAARSPVEGMVRALAFSGLDVEYDEDQDAMVGAERARQLCQPLVKWAYKMLTAPPSPDLRKRPELPPDKAFGSAIGLRLELEPNGNRWPVKLTGWLAQMYGPAGEMARWPSGVGAIATAGDEYVAWGRWKNVGTKTILELDNDDGLFTDRGRDVTPAASRIRLSASKKARSADENGEPVFTFQETAKAMGMDPDTFIRMMAWSGFIHR